MIFKRRVLVDANQNASSSVLVDANQNASSSVENNGTEIVSF